jgi:hypothetical protein
VPEIADTVELTHEDSEMMRPFQVVDHGLLA